jgi:hypothetical protein
LSVLRTGQGRLLGGPCHAQYSEQFCAKANKQIVLEGTRKAIRPASRECISEKMPETCPSAGCSSTTTLSRALYACLILPLSAAANKNSTIETG